MKRFYKCSQIHQNQKTMKLVALKDKRAKNKKNKNKY
jgi:hypothetical protein